jgi:hypothetical protein
MGGYSKGGAGTVWKREKAMANRKKYDWNKWFSRPRFTLQQGVDYDCSTIIMVQAVRNQASRRGLNVRVVEQAAGGGFTVVVVGRRGPGPEGEASTEVVLV